ncbi:hypothetical protein XELAEV_18044270mg [Xenopus laevis]|uniref:DUF5745 domain-containing protein n=1 Tax=Xenopus laevis TaxID=8355 RepID=A0A974BYI4_XENLA|nr:hypothetical protein XELAEV_18044270mg [Xenopus laevis]
MGTQESEWVDVANRLLTKCHINLQVQEVSECDAHVFVALYEAILGEKVPDLIPEPQNPETNAHNVQSVIDSLALDYLQVSLSHITGENIVNGDTESVQNLLEIFDGLLEYLTEQISEASSQNGEDSDGRDFSQRRQNDEVPKGQEELLPTLKPPPLTGSPALSSDIFVPSWEVDGSESTAELIRLGDTAQTFTWRGLRAAYVQREEEKPVPKQQSGEDDERLPHSSPCVSSHKVVERCDAMNGFSELRPCNEDLLPAIPLNHPYQPIEGRPSTTSREAVGSRGPSLRPVSEESLPSTRGPQVAAAVDSRPGKLPDGTETREGQNGKSISPCQKKVAFRTLPDIRLMTLRSTLSDCENGVSDKAEEEGEETDSTMLQEIGEEYTAPGSRHSFFHSRASDSMLSSITEEPFSVQRARNRLSEQELQEMSEKLSHKLDELDLMLKKALGSQTSVGEIKEEDKLSQHSDSIMEFRRKKQLQALQSSRKHQNRPRSLSSSPTPLSPPHHNLCAQFEDALHREAKGETGKIRRGVQKEMDLQRMKSRLLTNAYEEHLKDLAEREQVQLSKLKAKLKKTEEDCEENMFKEPMKKSQPEKVYSVNQIVCTPKGSKITAVRTQPRKAARMKIKENDLLPQLLDEFPFLQISPHTLRRMWNGQMSQVERLTRASQEDDRSERRLQTEVEEAQKKHDLLVDIIRKEQGQNQRLKDFRERIRLQKSAQNKMKENRQQAARAKRYYEDYHVQLRAKLMRARTREERLFKKLFEEGLELQKERLQEIRTYTREQREEQRKRHKDELDSMENYYKDQFSMLAEAVTHERQEIQAQEKAQAKTLHKIKRELRGKMEKEIQDLQEMIVRTDEDAFFRELEAERLKRRLQMASFHYSKSQCMQ